MYDFSRVFLPEDRPYRRASFVFNGKPKRTQRLEIIAPVDWIRTYDMEKEKEFSEMLDSNAKPSVDDPYFFLTPMRRKCQLR